MNRIRKSYRNIIKGFINFINRKEKIETIYKNRISICRKNECGYYDRNGEMENSIGNQGKESCGFCGCILDIKLRVLEEECPLSEINIAPYWNKEK